MQSRLRAGWKAVRFPLLAFLSVAAVLVVVVWFSTHHLDRQPDYPVGPISFRGGGILEGWFRFDGGWYRLIAEHGYFYAGPNQQSPVAYFPAYPLAMRAVHVMVGDWALTAIVTTFLSGLGVAILFYRWCVLEFDERTARYAVAVLLLYPYAWYLFGASYADALFLLSVLGAFLLLERGHPVLAGVVGIVATAGRPVGIAMVIGLAAVVLQNRGSLRNLKPADGGVLLSLLGLFGWMGYLSKQWGDPLLFATVQGAPGWDQQEGPSTWFKVTFFRRVRSLPRWLLDSIHHTTEHIPKPWTESAYTLGVLLQALLMVGAIVLVWFVVKRLGWGYGLYVLAVAAIPLLGSKDFQGVGRYLLAAFPCIAIVGAALASHRTWRWIWLPVSGALLVLLTSAFARGYYVA